jgi:hypothetical protein
LSDGKPLEEIVVPNQIHGFAVPVLVERRRRDGGIPHPQAAWFEELTPVRSGILSACEFARSLVARTIGVVGRSPSSCGPTPRERNIAIF